MRDAATAHYRETIARVSDLERRYRALGLERCADQQAQTLSVLRRAPDRRRLE